MKQQPPNTLISSYDCQKNLALPKIPDGATYYSRQFYFQNFTVVNGCSHGKLNTDTCTSYTWTENQYKRNSNTISSCILYHLRNVPDWTKYTDVVLISDGCGGQNKNTTVLTMLTYWLLFEAPEHIKEVQLTFPVTGHSYIPPDRVFGEIEKKIKRRETILDPTELIEITGEFATVVQLSESVTIYNFKSLVSTYIRPASQLHFKISQCKRVFLKRYGPDDIYVRGEYHYGLDIGVYKSIFKKKCSAMNLNHIPVIPEANRMDPAKKKDVDKLLKKHFGDDWRSLPSLKFYTYVTDVELEDDGNDEDPDEPLCEERVADFVEDLTV